MIHAALPAFVDTISHSICVALGELSVYTGSLGMLVAVVAASADAPESIGVGSDGPRLAQQLAAGCCCLALEPVHTTI